MTEVILHNHFTVQNLHRKSKVSNLRKLVKIIRYTELLELNQQSISTRDENLLPLLSFLWNFTKSNKFVKTTLSVSTIVYVYFGFYHWI